MVNKFDFLLTLLKCNLFNVGHYDLVGVTTFTRTEILRLFK
jgi:hypothetical protein